MGFAIIDIASTSLDADDRDCIAHPGVAGVILFARNYSNPLQLTALIRDIRSIKSELLIMVDQEGGRVQRFLSGFSRLPGAAHYGDLYESHGIDYARSELAAATSKCAAELLAVGIDLNLGPMLDLDVGHNLVVKDRCLHSDAQVVTDLASVVLESAAEQGILSCLKHFPGHGWVDADSHEVLPFDTRSLDELLSADLQPFLAHLNNVDFLMPAHIIYSQIDQLPVTFSRIWLQDYLRTKWSYAGIIISDDLSMNASREMGSVVDCTEAALAAGCDLVLICNDRVGVSEVLSCCTQNASCYLSDTMQKLAKQRLYRNDLCLP